MRVRNAPGAQLADAAPSASRSQPASRANRRQTSVPSPCGRRSDPIALLAAARVCSPQASARAGPPRRKGERAGSRRGSGRRGRGAGFFAQTRLPPHLTLSPSASPCRPRARPHVAARSVVAPPAAPLAHPRGATLAPIAVCFIARSRIDPSGSLRRVRALLPPPPLLPPFPPFSLRGPRPIFSFFSRFALLVSPCLRLRRLCRSSRRRCCTSR